ncbi:hypothetical protein Trydic_g8780 [Trypoxylus dichotomus]
MELTYPRRDDGDLIYISPSGSDIGMLLSGKIRPMVISIMKKPLNNPKANTNDLNFDFDHEVSSIYNLRVEIVWECSSSARATRHSADVWSRLGDARRKPTLSREKTTSAALTPKSRGGRLRRRRDARRPSASQCSCGRRFVVVCRTHRASDGVRTDVLFDALVENREAKWCAWWYVYIRRLPEGERRRKRDKGFRDQDGTPEHSGIVALLSIGRDHVRG